MTLRRAGWFASGMLLFLLDWAALDDITSGSDPNLSLEWAVVAATAMVLMTMVAASVLKRPD